MPTFECVFCAIVSGDAPATVVATSDVAVAIVPLGPVTAGHIIVLPRRHVADATTDPELTGDVMTMAATLAQQYDAANIITSIGAVATQTMFHLHLHIVPRRNGDALCLPWTGQRKGVAR
jgi:histidine triad (HIT) family protein